MQIQAIILAACPDIFYFGDHYAEPFQPSISRQPKRAIHLHPYRHEFFFLDGRCDIRPGTARNYPVL